MFPWSFLLRVLLSLSLVLTGASQAAMAAMPMGMAMPAVQAGASPGHAVAAEAAHAHHEQHAAAVGAEACHDGAAPIQPPCCDMGACQCACAHLLPGDVAAVGLRSTPFSAAPFVPGHTLAYRSPALPRSIRPPIA